MTTLSTAIISRIASMAINVGNGGGEVADGDKLTSHDRPYWVLIAFNTLVNNKRNIVQTHRDNGLGAMAITFAYIMIVGGEQSAFWELRMIPG